MVARAAARGVLPGEPGRLAVPKLHCRYCAAPVPKGRRNWCSQACIDEHLVRNNPGVARAQVFKRDRGICSSCGRDTEALALQLGAWLACDWVLDVSGHHGELGHQAGELFAKAERRRAFARRFGIRLNCHWSSPPWPGSDGVPRASLRTLWEMDHVRPVVEGGGGCGLDNLRTLCCPCHKRATRELAARRRAQAQPRMVPGLGHEQLSLPIVASKATGSTFSRPSGQPAAELAPPRGRSSSEG